KNVTGSLAFSAEAITYRNGIIRDAVLNVDLANGEMTISQLSGQFPGGSELAVFGFVTEVKGKPRFEGELQSSVNDLHGVLRWLGQDLKGIRSDRLRKVTLATRVVAVPEQIQLTGLDLQFDSSRLTGGVAIAMTKRPSFGADIALDRLNLDAYFPKQPAPAGKMKGDQSTTPASASGGAKKKTQQENPFAALKMLSQVDVNLKARIKTVVYQGNQIKDITFDGTLYNGSLEIRRFDLARIAGAKATLSGVLKGLDGMPEASGLVFNVRAGDMAKLFRFSGLDPALAPQGLGPVTFSGRIDGNLLAPTVKVKVEGAGATAQLNGQLDGLAGVPAVKGLRFQLNAADPTGLLKLAGIKTPGAAKQLGAIRVTGSLDGNLLKPTLALNLNAAGGTVALSGPVNTLPVGNRVDFSLKASFPDLARLARALGADYRPAGKIGGLDLQARLRGGPKELTLSGMTAKIGIAQLTGDVVVGLEGPRPNIKANLSAGALVIDPFLPIGKTASLWPGTKIMPAAWTGLGRGLGEGGHPLAKPVARTGARTAGRWSRDPIDLTGLAAFDGDIRFKSPSVRFEKYSLQNADLSLKMAKGRINAEKLTGVLFGGALHATGTATASARPRIETAFALENMNVGQATRALTGKSMATGRMSLKARLQTSGRHLADMVSGLSGSGSIRMKGIDVKQGKTGTALAGALGLVTALNQFAGVLGGGSKKGSGLVDISGTFDITGGIARSQDMKVAASVGNGVASGSVDLPRWLIDVKGHVKLSQNLLTAFLSSRTKRDVTQAVPFTVRGRLDAPTINLDTSKLPGGGLPIPGADRLIKKLPKGVGGILQGILGGGTPQPPPEPTQPQPQTQPQQQTQPRVIRPEDLLKELFRRR
ncbi:MAG: AsmA-like C-terminal region-containing protein, partial [Alphaproteobacteria bacterium]